MKVDLHTHSTFSDGTVTPEKLVKIALRERVKVLALCDHDTTDGIESFMNASVNTELRAVAGVELSVSWNIGTCHIVGLNLDWKNDELQSVLHEYRDGRDRRNLQIIENLRKLGIPIEVDDILKNGIGEAIGRPHIAKAMVQINAVRSVDEAFDHYLKKGAKAYVPRELHDPMTALITLKKAHAVTVLAHPVHLKITDDQLKMFINQLKTFGLDAIEVFTPHHSDEQVMYYYQIAKDTGLGVSGGSDYHGKFKPERKLGMYGKLKPIPETVLDILRNG
ncbi:MAG: PHP domain-containing protein [Chitinispirillaceae bacterium]|nr:PHP domain-containing protein [Chitinispirillaceae bacterium]